MMKACLTLVCFLGLLVAFGIAGLEAADGGCGASDPDKLALKLTPCAGAAQDGNAKPPAACCTKVKEIGKSPDCLCAVMMSNTAKAADIDPKIALSIPKRCNFANRPVGYKCGAYTLP